MNCLRCGELQRDEAIFCPSCGNRQRPNPQVPPPLSPKQGHPVRKVLLVLLVIAFFCAAGFFVVWKGLRPGDAAVTGPPLPAETRPPAAATSRRREPPLIPSAGLEIFFPDLRWGDPPTPDMTPDDSPDQTETIKSYVRSGGVRSFDGVPFERVGCRFDRQRFMTADFYVSAENAEPLRAAAERRFGAPQRTPDGALKWIHKDTVVLFVSDPTSDEHGFAIYSTGLGDFALREAAAQSKEASPSESSTRPQASAERGVAAPVQEGPVYTAEFSCVGPGGMSASLVQCFYKSSIKVRRGNRSRVYSAPDLASAAGPHSSVKIDLPASFQIEAMNSAPFDVIVLSLTITETATGKVVFEDQAGRWGWIKVKN